MLEVINVSSNIIRKEAIKKNLIFFVCACLFSLSANGQNFDLKKYTVISNGQTLENPFTGGYTAAQLNEIDFNMDGVMDLLVFDRRGDIAVPYIHDGVVGSTNYTHEPKYLLGLPPMNDFVRVRDYNNDGIPDIFTVLPNQSGNMSVYTGSWDGERLRFDLYEVSNWPEDILLVTSNGFPTNLYLGPGDVPAIADIDFDGDLDVLAFESGGSFVSFYKNMVVEKSLGLDTFDFIIGDFCWGKFKEGGLDGTLFLSDNQNECAEEFAPNIDFVERHAGSAIEVFDFQCDGDYDMMLGDLLGRNIVLAINEPDGDNAYVPEAITNFPANDPVDMHVFLGAWVLDVDHDGDQDFVVCPNDESNVENVNNLHYYENIGADCNEEFVLNQTDFLNEGSIDLGTDASPAFLDFNADGLIDILVGTSGENDNSGMANNIGLVLFENIGDPENPKYRLVDDDYLSFSINSEFSADPTPTVGDLDGDGDEDIIVGDSQGKLYYFENTAGEGNISTFAQAVYPYKNIDVGAIVEPYIFDYNDDGLGDLFIGEKNSNSNEGIGNVNYFENIGKPGIPDFDADVLVGNNTPTFGYINTKVEFESSGNSAPVPFYAGDKLYVMCATQQGFLQLYQCSSDDPDMPCDTIDLEFGNIYEGDQTSIDLSDIDADGFLEVVVGNKRGGIAIYNTIINIDGTISDTEELVLTEEKEIKIYPNPSSDEVFIDSEFAISEYYLSNIYGQIISSGSLKNNKISLGNLPQGVYFVSLKIGNEFVVKKLMKN